MTNAPARLILIYNADGGLLNAAKDMAHKILRPSTYPCSLCGLTYGWFAMQGAWRRYLAGLLMEKLFLHKDEVPAALPDLAIALPAILLQQADSAPVTLVSAGELDALTGVEALIALLDARLRETCQPAPSAIIRR